MNFLNPHTEFYFEPKSLKEEMEISFCREVIWVFLKNLENKLKMFQHRVNIVFTDKNEDTGSSRFESIYQYKIHINYDGFKKLNDAEKRRKLLDIVHEGFSGLGREYKWDLEAIDLAFERSMKEVNHFKFHTNYKMSRDRKSKARIGITLQNNMVSFYAEFLNEGQNDLISKKLLTTPQINFSWWGKIRDFGWFDKSNFGLKLLSGELWIVTNKTTLEVVEEYLPKKRNQKEIESFLRGLKI